MRSVLLLVLLLLTAVVSRGRLFHNVYSHVSLRSLTVWKSLLFIIYLIGLLEVWEWSKKKKNSPRSGKSQGKAGRKI